MSRKALNNMDNKIYIASRAKDGGIYEYTFVNGVYKETAFTPMDSPMYMIISNRKMHVLLRAPFDCSDSGLISYDLSENGKLINPSEILSTKGEIACHLAEIDGIVYCVNYTSGSVVKMPDKLVVHKGGKQSHTHFVGLTPDNKYMCVTDLGLDKIYMYDKQLNPLKEIEMPEGHGVRHLVFSENGEYVFTANELKSTVSVLKYNNGDMDLIDTTSSIPEGEKSAPSAIRLYKGHIYVANRFHNSISKLLFDGQKLWLKDIFDCMGKTPRDFIFDENHIVCANQESDSVTVFEEQPDMSFSLIQEFKIKEPMCVICKEK